MGTGHRSVPWQRFQHTAGSTIACLCPRGLSRGGWFHHSIHRLRSIVASRALSQPRLLARLSVIKSARRPTARYTSRCTVSASLLACSRSVSLFVSQSLAIGCRTTAYGYFITCGARSDPSADAQSLAVRWSVAYCQLTFVQRIVPASARSCHRAITPCCLPSF